MMSGATSVWSPASCSACASSAVRGRAAPSVSPIVVLPRWVRRTWPGPMLAALHMLEPPSTRSLPSAAWSCSTLPMPFWKVIAQPSRRQHVAGGRGGGQPVLLASTNTITRSAVGGRSRRSTRRAARADRRALRHPQPVPIDRVDVRLPGIDQADLVPGESEQPAVAAAHRACSDHRDLHVPSSPAAADLSPRAAAGKHRARQSLGPRDAVGILLE